jgi:hypothetical protein
MDCGDTSILRPYLNFAGSLFVRTLHGVNYPNGWEVYQERKCGGVSLVQMILLVDSSDVHACRRGDLVSERPLLFDFNEEALKKCCLFFLFTWHSKQAFWFCENLRRSSP